MLVVPAVLVASGVAWLLRGWLSRSVWHFLGAWLGGVILIGITATGAVWTLARIMDAQLAECAESSEYYLCAYDTHMIGYPVIIGLLSVGLYLIVPLVWRIARIFYKKSASEA